MKKGVAIFSLFSFLFVGFFSFAYADTLQISNTIGGSSYVFTASGRPQACQTFTPTGNFTLSSATVQLRYLDSPISYHIRAYITTGCPTGSTPPTYLATSDTDFNTSALTNSFADVSFTFPPTALTGSTTYGLALMSPDGYPTSVGNRVALNFQEASAPTDSYPNGDLYGCSNTTQTCTTGNPTFFFDDAYFQIYSAPADAISIVSPASTSTPIADFQFFTIDFTNATTTGAFPSSTPDFYINQIYLGTSSSSLPTLVGSSISDQPDPYTLQKNTTLSNGTYYIQAEKRYCPDIYSSCELVASSTITSFVVGSPYVPSGGYEVPTATSTSYTLNCDTGGVLSDSLCYVLKYLFIPSTSALQNFADLGNTLQTKPPIGYFNAVSLVLSNATTTASSTFDLSNLANSAGSSVLTPLRTGFSWLLWFVFGFWVFKRFRHFSL